MSIKDTITCNPSTSVCGMVIIGFVGAAFLMGKVDYSNFLGACIAIATAFGLLVAKDGKKEDCKIPPAEDGKKE